jgi:uncharacterized protein
VTTTRPRKPGAPSPIQSISLPSVKLFWLNLDGVKSRLTRAAQKLAEMHPEITEIWLFGSLARGEAVPGSDADVLVVLEDCELSFLERSSHYQPEFGGVGVNLLAYTRQELEQMAADGHKFLERITSERFCLFKRQGG